jgi:hypothetical protein
MGSRSRAPASSPAPAVSSDSSSATSRGPSPVTPEAGNSAAVADSGLSNLECGGGGVATSAPPRGGGGAPGSPSDDDRATSARDAARLQGLIVEASTPPENAHRIDAIIAGLGAARDAAVATTTLRPVAVIPFATFHISDDQIRLLLQEATLARQTLQRRDVTHAEATTPEATRRNEAAHDLGQVTSLDGFCTQAGRFADAVAPNDGSEGQVTLAFNLPVVANGSVTIGMRFEMGVERDRDKVKVRTQVGGRIVGTADAWIVEAWLAAQIYGYIEAETTSGAESVRLLMYAIQQRVAGGSQRLADAMFARRFVQETERDIEGEDYVDSGLGVEVSGGVGVGPSGSGGPEVEAAASRDSGTRISRGEGAGGGLERRDAVTWRGSAGFEQEPFSVAGEVESKWVAGAFHEAEVEVSGEAELDLDHLERVVGPEFLSGLVSSVGSLVRSNSALMAQGDAGVGRRIGGFADFLTGSTGLRFAEAAAIQRLFSRYGERAPGMTLSHSITVKAKVDKDGLVELTARLARLSTITAGTHGEDSTDRDAFFLELEATTPVLIGRVSGHVGGGPARAPGAEARG